MLRASFALSLLALATNCWSKMNKHVPAAESAKIWARVGSWMWQMIFLGACSFTVAQPRWLASPTPAPSCESLLPRALNSIASRHAQLLRQTLAASIKQSMIITLSSGVHGCGAEIAIIEDVTNFIKSLEAKVSRAASLNGFEPCMTGEHQV